MGDEKFAIEIVSPGGREGTRREMLVNFPPSQGMETRHQPDGEVWNKGKMTIHNHPPFKLEILP